MAPVLQLFKFAQLATILKALVPWTKSKVSAVSILEILLFAGWLLPIVFIGAFAVFVTTYLEKTSTVEETHGRAHAVPAGYRSERSVRSSTVSRRAGRIRHLAHDTAVSIN